jgi:hypothetical protein
MKKPQYLTTLLVVIGAATLGAGGVFAASYLDLLPTRQAATASPTPKLEVDQIIDQISDSVELPRGEVPSLATVTDPGKLQDQTFFKQAEVGDKVLLYTEAKRAVLYRPKTGKVVETGPFVLNPVSDNPLINASPPIPK